MKLERYVPIKALVTKDNNIIPVWDNKIQFEETEAYGNVININGTQYYDTVEAIYDLVTKSVSTGINLDMYPLHIDIPYKIGQSLLYEIEYRKLTPVIVNDIVFEKYDIYFRKGVDFEQHFKKYFSKVVIDNNQLYTIKVWKPSFILSNGDVIHNEFELYKIV